MSGGKIEKSTIGVVALTIEIRILIKIGLLSNQVELSDESKTERNTNFLHFAHIVD